MKIITSLCLVMHLAGLSADSYPIPYKLLLDESFLLGNDSVNLVVHNGRFLQKVKLKRGESLEIGMTYFIPCFSGRSRSADEVEQEILEWNGTTYNFYYEATRLMVTVPAIAAGSPAGSIRTDSTYHLSLEMVEPVEFERAQFRRLYYEFVGDLALLQIKGIKLILENRGNRYTHTAARFLSVIRFRYFTVVEAGNLLKASLPENGTVEYSSYYSGKVTDTLRISTSNGYVTAVTY